MKQTAVEWLYDQLEFDDSISMDDIEKIFEQAKAMERSQKAEEYLKGFKDGKEYQIKLDELTFGSNKQIMITDIPITNKDKEELMEILNRMQRNLTFKSE
jgi:DNA integrity scanning protein DisA with diadenylate cyclase activity